RGGWGRWGAGLGAVVDGEEAFLGTGPLLVGATRSERKARGLAEAAGAASPGVVTGVRMHGEAERRQLEEDGVGVVLMGAREFALG
ncbi:hypothetical protein CCS92_34590, partial [Methylobacterium radiotolerans]